MSKTVKISIAVLMIFSICFAVSAEPVSYAFSGFGGGLPSSAQMLSEDALSPDDIALLRSGGDSAGFGAGKIVFFVVGGVVVTALLVGGTIWFVNRASDACSESCGDACSDVCEQFSTDFCNSLISESCNTSSCTTSASNVFSRGLAAMPVFVP